MNQCPEELKELFRTVYKLSDSQIELFYYLCDKEEKRVNEIAEDLGKSRSTVQRLLKSLLSVNIIKRKSQTYSSNKKGRYYLYSVVEKENLKEKLKERVNEWRDEKIEMLKYI